jgi:hypothetical protein
MTAATPVGIVIEPPIPYADLAAKADADASDRTRTAGTPRYLHLFDGVDIGDLTFAVDRHHPAGPCATAILACRTPPADGFQRRAALARIIRDFAHAAEGRPRTFDGHLASERSGEPSQLYVRDGEVVETTPELVWHDPPGQSVGTRPSAPAPATEVR